jgi:hypothetical protein
MKNTLIKYIETLNTKRHIHFEHKTKYCTIDKHLAYIIYLYAYPDNIYLVSYSEAEMQTLLLSEFKEDILSAIKQLQKQISNTIEKLEK